MEKKSEIRRKRWINTRQLCIFAMLGTLMFLSKLLMEWAPNIHFLAMLTVVYTVVYRTKALIPLSVFVLLTGVYAGFNVWWVPYLYLWLILWGVTMLLPRHMPPRVALPVYSVVCFLHGLCYGTLYAPAQALFFGYTWQMMLSWIAAGFPWDVIHACGNLAASFLILPLVSLLQRLERGHFLS